VAQVGFGVDVVDGRGYIVTHSFSERGQSLGSVIGD
jgi:hypothetical protein